MSVAAGSSQMEECKVSRGIARNRPRVSFYVADPAGSDQEGGRSDHNNSSGSSSSIGQNSDSGGDRSASSASDNDEPEVQSSYRGPLHSMDSMEGALPIRRGISNFYAGKSKSFTSLADAAASATAKELSKPDNPYNRKRKNLIILKTRDWERSHRCISGDDPTNPCGAVLVDSAGNSGVAQQLTPRHNFGCGNNRPSFGSRSFSLFDLQAANTSDEERNEGGSQAIEGDFICQTSELSFDGLIGSGQKQRWPEIPSYGSKSF